MESRNARRKERRKATSFHNDSSLFGLFQGSLGRNVQVLTSLKVHLLSTRIISVRLQKTLADERQLSFRCFSQGRQNACFLNFGKLPIEEGFNR